MVSGVRDSSGLLNSSHIPADVLQGNGCHAKSCIKIIECVMLFPEVDKVDPSLPNENCLINWWLLEFSHKEGSFCVILKKGKNMESSPKERLLFHTYLFRH